MEYTCCFCKKKFKDYGNNPAPADNNQNHRCCDDCNIKIVIPSRIANYFK